MTDLPILRSPSFRVDQATWPEAVGEVCEEIDYVLGLGSMTTGRRQPLGESARYR
jgi:hypothetical protein